MGKRRWGDWPRRFLAEANSVSGVFGFAGAGVGGLGALAAAPVVAAAGGAVALAGAGWCVIRSIPPQLGHPRDAQGRQIRNLAELKDMSPVPRRIGFIGVSQVGKSTLVAHLQALTPAGARTDNPYAVVVRLAGSPEIFFALIDAAGHQYSQQFKVAENSDDLIVFLDHSSTDVERRSSPSRLKAQRRFLTELADHLQNCGHFPQRIHFLMNKRDLWANGPSTDTVTRWFAREVQRWPAHATSTISSAPHSNLVAADITNLINHLRSWAR